MAFASKWLESRRLAMVLPLLAPPVLDVGCGRCPAFDAAPEGYVGLDLDREPLLERPAMSIEVLCGSALELPFQPGTFQTVLLMAVLEHLPDPRASLREAARVLRPGGRVVITTPTPIGDRIHHQLARVGITSKHAAEEHQSIFSGALLTRAVQDAGLLVSRYRPFLLGGNQVCLAVRPDGVRRLAA